MNDPFHETQAKKALDGSTITTPTAAMSSKQHSLSNRAMQTHQIQNPLKLDNKDCEP
jgi:hypothetical protein